MNVVSTIRELFNLILNLILVPLVFCCLVWEMNTILGRIFALGEKALELSEVFSAPDSSN
jgi:hypothetical protein